MSILTGAGRLHATRKQKAARTGGKSMHKMPNGHMMSDKAMKKKMKVY